MNVEEISDYAQAQEVAKWRICTDRLQISCIAGIFIMLVVLDKVPKHTAHWLVWYLASIELVLATLSFISGQKFIKLQHAQWDRSTKRIKDMYDKFEQDYKSDDKTTLR